MAFWQWTGQAIVRLWVGALLASGACLALALSPLGRPWKLFGLLPYPDETVVGWLRFAGQLAAVATREAPALAAAVVWIPGATLLLTLAWLAARLLPRVGGT